MYDVIVVGGGPSGVIAAITCSNNGLKTLLIEKNDELLRKFKLTGGGRCNLTNNYNKQKFLNDINDGTFFKDSFSKFNNIDLKNFFERNGIIFTLEKNRYFPKSGKSQELINFLKGELNKTDRMIAEVLDIGKEKLFVVDTTKGTFKSKIVIVATGGKSYPLTGSTGFGYEIAKKFGHKVTPLFPSETFIYVEGTKELSGISIEANCKYLDYNESGSILFTHFGLSGPAILNLSEKIARNIAIENKIYMDLIPKIKPEELEADFLSSKGSMKLSEWLVKFFPKRLAFSLFLELQSKKMASISKKERQEIIKTLKEYKLIVANTGPIEKAIVTAGGISLDEINSVTFESKIVKGLYFVGEVLDLHGPIGGYNLTIAFSSGFSAASHIRLTE
jgi:predicted Rossmann fold flavoprotein